MLLDCAFRSLRQFSDRTSLDDTGKPHSDELHLVERRRRPSAGLLEIQHTSEDPKALLNPFNFTRILTMITDRDL